jgi:hypothetical protein
MAAVNLAVHNNPFQQHISHYMASAAMVKVALLPSKPAQLQHFLFQWLGTLFTNISCYFQRVPCRDGTINRGSAAPTRDRSELTLHEIRTRLKFDTGERITVLHRVL